MKRFHVHVGVRDLDASIRFYSALFATEPTVRKDDYAKWMIEDPRLNFAISTKNEQTGIRHLGMQADSAEELAELGARLRAADTRILPESGVQCCYAQSDKLWAEDPQGTRWETFHTYGSVTTYYGAQATCASDAKDAAAMTTGHASIDSAKAAAPACCDASTPQGVCCAPKTDRSATASCCGPADAKAA